MMTIDDLRTQFDSWFRDSLRKLQTDVLLSAERRDDPVDIDQFDDMIEIVENAWPADRERAIDEVIAFMRGTTS
jgi:hypothetical protein